MTAPDSYQNKRESVSTYDVFRSMDAHAIFTHLLKYPGKVHTRRNERREKNGTLKQESTQRDDTA